MSANVNGRRRKRKKECVRERERSLAIMHEMREREIVCVGA